MKIRYGLMSGLVLCFLGSVVFGQAGGPLGLGGGAMIGQAPPGPAPVEGEMLPGEKFNNVRLDDFLDYLKQKVTGFNGVIVRAPGVPTDYPTLPSMTTKNVTIGQFLEFVKTSYPGVDVKRIDGPTAPLYVIRIENANGQIAGGAPMNPGAAPGGPDPAATQVIVFPLDKIIDKLVYEAPGHVEDRKKALDDVLSLVEAAMKTQGGEAAPTLQVHEATQALVARGTNDQLRSLSQVLQTLKPTGDDLNDIHNYEANKTQSLDSQMIRQLREENAAMEQKIQEMKTAATQPQK